MWSLAIKVLIRDPRYEDLPDAARYDISLKILLSLDEASRKGTLSDWNPPITKLLEAARKAGTTTQSYCVSVVGTTGEDTPTP
jgi:hypothetical protein